MLIKKITVDGKEITFAASARLPRLYRMVFGRDVITDMASLSDNFERVRKAKNANDITELDTTDQLSIIDLTIFENLAYCMNKLAEPSVPDIDTWLDQFGTFDIYEVFPQLMELWAKNQKGISIPKKK